MYNSNQPAKSQFLAQQAANGAMPRKPAILPRYNLPASISGAAPKTTKPYDPTPSIGGAAGGIVGGARDIIKGAHEGAVDWTSNQMTDFAKAYGGGGGQQPLPNSGGGGSIKPVPTPQSIPAPNAGGGGNGGNDQPQINAGSQGGVMVGPNGEVKSYTKDMIDNLTNRNTYNHDTYMKSLPQAQGQPQSQGQPQQRAGIHMFNPASGIDFSTGDSSFDKRHGLAQRAAETARMNAQTDQDRLGNTKAIAEGNQAVDREQMQFDNEQTAKQAAYDKNKYMQNRLDKNTQFDAKLANQLGDRMNKPGFWEMKRRIDSAPPELKQGYKDEFKQMFDFSDDIFNDFITKGTKKGTDDDMSIPILPPAQ